MTAGWITDWVPSARWPHYTRSNAGEVLPTPAAVPPLDEWPRRGRGSHAIIVGRELGPLCVVSATDATTRIADGATVAVDGDTGLVTVVGRSGS